MSKLKQCIYTVILLLTCFVASPFIYKQIWKNSELHEKKAAAKEPVVSSQTTPPAASEAPREDSSQPQPTSEGEASPPQDEQPQAAPQINWVQSGPEYFDDALFIGDSRTVGLRDYGTLKNADYFCDIGLSAYKIDESYVNGSTIWQYLSNKKFGKIYIMLGINEVGNDIEYTAAAYRKLVDGVRAAQPDAIIYLEGNLHVASYKQTPVISNERIDMLNAKIQELADNSKTFYLDVNGVFDDETGALTADYTSDGIHVFAKHYAAWCDWLCANTVTIGQAAAEPDPNYYQATEAASEAEPAESSPQNEEFSNQ